MRTATIVLGAVAVVLGAARGVYKELAGIAARVPVATSFSGAVATHLFSGRFQFLAQSYEMMMSRLNRLLESWERVPEQDKIVRASEFAARFEEIPLVENKQRVERIAPAARQIHAYWFGRRASESETIRGPQQPMRKAALPGRNDPRPCGSGR